MPDTRVAAYITGPGPADAIRIGELPIPPCGPTDVLVRADAMAVNFVDTFVRSGAYQTPLPLPFIIGRDVVGAVEAVGAGVAGFRPGDAVWCNSLGHQGRQGSFAEYVIVPADRLYHLPAGVDPQLAVSMAHTAATAHLALFREAGLRLGETVLVGGGAGGVGSAAVQLAHAAGARVIATAQEQDGQWCQDCGADVVIDYRDPQATERIRDAAPDGIDVHLDTSGHHDFDASLPLLAGGGRLVLMAAMSARPTLPVGAVYTRDISLRGFVISNASVADLATAARTINTLLDAHRLQSRIGARLPLRDAARAHQLLEGPASDRPPGRILVFP
jgi:NADPH:quinone reductase-like Zn-dependent oxidoreductase